MFAVDHAATALLMKRLSPTAPLVPILISVQAMELAWVGLNYLGIERTTTEAAVHSVADVHLAHMPYSHSVGTPIGAAVLAWLIIEKGLGRAALGRAGRVAVARRGSEVAGVDDAACVADIVERGCVTGECFGQVVNEAEQQDTIAVEPGVIAGEQPAQERDRPGVIGAGFGVIHAAIDPTSTPQAFEA